MPRIAIALLATLALVLPGGVAFASPDRGRWRRPLPGAVVGSFSFDPAAPYERGRRRGLDLEGRPGAPVLAACSGVVTHAGAVPRWGRGVTVRCGGLVATELGLGRVLVRSGALVLRGARIGRLGGRGLLRLGARRAAVRQGYVDPAPLLGTEVPWGPAPAGPPRRRSRPPAAAVRRRGPVLRAADPAPARPMPWAAWAGAALLATGAGGGQLAHGRRRARRRADPALAHR